MRRYILAALLILIISACNLNETEKPSATPQVVTATLSITLPPPTLEPTHTPEPSATSELPTITPSPEATLTALPTATSLPATLSPTRVVVAPPTVLPLDDGSGQQITGTGLNTAASAVTLPESLYYLSDQSGSVQVWRLSYGMPVPEQRSFSTDSIRAFDVAPDGTLAYITTRGEMVIGGMPFLPPSGEQVTALAWSPGGEWLAYTLHSESSGGLWLRNRDNRTFQIQTNTAESIYTGPIEWRPDSTEVLIRWETATYSRVNITSGETIPLNDLAPGSFQTAHWSVNGTAIITSGAAQVQSVDMNGVIQTLVSVALWPDDAQQFNNGTVTFVAGPAENTGPKRLYRLDPGTTNPTPVTDPLTENGTVDFLWDNLGQQVLLVVYDPAESALGLPALRAVDGTRQDLSPLLGMIGSPCWGPVFEIGDNAHIQTTEGESLNVRDAPSTGNVLAMLPNGTRVTVRGGPRFVDGGRWWQIQTSDGITGWATESVTGSNGFPLRTLLPSN